MNSISFFKLPSLVQSKILRDHIPVFDKAFTLSTMPEFQYLLQSKHSWSNEFFNFYNLLKSLKPGLYFSIRGKTWNNGCFVSIANSTVLFEFFNLHKYVFNIYERMLRSKTFDFKGSLLDLTTFLKTFLKKFYFFDEKKLIFYRLCDSCFDKHHEYYFFVNCSTNCLYWLDGRIYTFKKNRCLTLNKDSKKHIVFLFNKGVIYLKCLKFEELHGRCFCRKYTVLKPLDIFEIHHRRKPIQFEFQMDGLVNLKMLTEKFRFMDFDLVEVFPEVSDVIEEYNIKLLFSQSEEDEDDDDIHWLY